MLPLIGNAGCACSSREAYLGRNSELDATILPAYLVTNRSHNSRVVFRMCPYLCRVPSSVFTQYSGPDVAIDDRFSAPQGLIDFIFLTVICI